MGGDQANQATLSWFAGGIPFEGFDRESPLPSPRYFQASFGVSNGDLGWFVYPLVY